MITGQLSSLARVEPRSALREAALGLAQDYLVDWFQAAPRPMLMIKVPDLHIITCNDAGDRLLLEGPDLRQQQGRLAFCDAAAAERFRQHLTQDGNDLPPWPLKQRDRDRHLILKVDRLVTANAAPVAIVAVHFSDGDTNHQWSDIGSIFGLTRAEERIAKKLTGGKNVEELAAELTISVETARTHIRRIYGKVGVGSRERLSAILLPFRVG